jgi:hypothetical protein
MIESLINLLGETMMDVVENKVTLKEFYGEQTWEVFRTVIRNCGIRWNVVLTETYEELAKEKIPLGLKAHFDSALYVSVISNMLTYKFLTLATQNPELANETIEIDLLSICDTVRQSMAGKIVEEFLADTQREEIKKNECVDPEVVL